MKTRISPNQVEVTYPDGEVRRWFLAVDEKNDSVTVISDLGEVATRTYSAWDADHLVVLAEAGLKRPVPATITAAQARRAVIRAGLMPAIKAMMESPAVSEELATQWEYETVFRRESPDINAIAGALGLSSDTVDDLFRQAAKIGT